MLAILPAELFSTLPNIAPYNNNIMLIKSVDNTKDFTVPVLNYKSLLAGHTVAMVTYFTAKMITTCSPMAGQCFDTMIVASSD